MKKNRKSAGDDGGQAGKSKSDSVLKINSMRLVRLVRSQEVLYNSNADGYNDKSYKDAVWESVYRALFPQYDTMEPSMKDCIGVNVRRRWKTLRDAIAREVRRNATLENYCRKKESPVIAELEFLIPHIKSAHCLRLAGELGLSAGSHYPAEYEEQEDDRDDSFNDLIDLTEDYDIKPMIVKVDPEQSYVDGDTSNDTLPHDVFTSTEHTHEGDATIHGTVSSDACINVNWSREYCTVAEFKGGEFINPTVLEQDNADSPGEEEKANSPGECRKRPRTENEDPAERQAKFLQLLSNLEWRERAETRVEQETHDGDRMFLLSLVSDLRRVPAARKMQVKAEIANAIARANQ